MNILDALFQSGKTSLAEELCFATQADVITATCVCGGRAFSPIGAGKGTPLIAANDRDNIGAAGIDGKYLTPIAWDDPIIRHIVAGDAIEHSNGLYISSAHGSQTLRSHYGDNCNLRAALFDVDCNKVNKWTEAAYVIVGVDGEFATYMTVDWVMAQQAPKTFGFPYIRLGESAVLPPTSWVNVEFYEEHDGAAGIVRSASSQLKKAIVSDKISDYLAYLVKTGQPDDVNTMIEFTMQSDDADDKLKHFALLLDDITKRNSAVFSEGKIKRIAPSDRVGLFNYNGVTMVLSKFASSLFMSLGRCFIDSINVSAMTAKGNAFAKGLGSDFFAAMATTTESEAIAFYSPTAASVEEDPLTSRSLGGYVDGFVYAERSTPSSLLRNDTWWITSRQGAKYGKTRETQYLLATPAYVFGQSCLYDRKTKKIIPYGNDCKTSLGVVRSRFDECLIKPAARKSCAITNTKSSSRVAAEQRAGTGPERRVFTRKDMVIEDSPASLFGGDIDF